MKVNLIFKPSIGFPKILVTTLSGTTASEGYGTTGTTASEGYGVLSVMQQDLIYCKTLVRTEWVCNEYHYDQHWVNDCVLTVHQLCPMHTYIQNTPFY